MASNIFSNVARNIGFVTVSIIGFVAVTVTGNIGCVTTTDIGSIGLGTSIIIGKRWLRYGCLTGKISTVIGNGNITTIIRKC